MSRAAVLLLAGLAAASVIDMRTLSIDFTDIADARQGATWTLETLDVTESGLGWNGEAASSRDGWVETAPVAVGLSWRAPYAASVHVSIHWEPYPFTSGGGGTVFARYSPDLRNWSSWQALQTGEPGDDLAAVHYSGELRVPESERRRYSALLYEYAGLEVPWKSDEHAAVEWILDAEPDFFQGQLPFIGYVQFRYEAGFHGGRRITSLIAEVICSIGGMHYAPDNPDDYWNRDSAPWSFVSNTD
jgi:hypothetical protein